MSPAALSLSSCLPLMPRREALPERTTRSLCPPQGCSRSGEPVPITPRLLRLQPGPPPSTPMMSSYSRLHPAATCGVGRYVRDHRPPSPVHDTRIRRASWEPLSHRADQGKGGRLSGDQVPLTGLLRLAESLLCVALVSLCLSDSLSESVFLISLVGGTPVSSLSLPCLLCCVSSSE